MKKRILACICALTCILSSTDLSVMKTEAASPVSFYVLPNTKILKKNETDSSEMSALNYSNPLSFSAAANERESAQLLLQSSSNVSNIEIITSDLVSDKNDIITKDNVSAAFEHYIYLDPDSTGFWALNKKDGYYPDPLIPYNVAKAAGGNKLDVSKGKNQGIWFTLNVPKGTNPGIYSSNFTIKYTVNNSSQSDIDKISTCRMA